MTTVEPQGGQDTGASERLDEFDKDEWFDVMKRVRPDLSREYYEDKWAEFQREKQRRTAQ